MTEVNLVKRLLVLALCLLTAFTAVACTRDKPETPLATIVAAGPTTPPGTVLPASTGSSSSTASGLSIPTVTITATVELSPTLPAPTIAPPPTATPAPSSSTTPGTYTVQWGDWLNKIAAQFGITA